MTSTWQRLQELSDRTDLTELAVGITRCLDTRDFAGLAGIYTPDAELTMPGSSTRGATGIAEIARRNHETFDRTQHFVTGPVVTLNGDQASLVADVVAALVSDTGAVRLVGSRYELRAVRTTAGWRFAGHAITPVWDR
ncbi:hypothetical protein GFY24_30310 [Nocardia sp. SYP-A9097]|uniref:nuclear transport factor 2 family protein n=1 Tax=Nocardia sp. SYP-A9097 TaxID=2663237 RepID=UPI00129AF669|nr:nuclear transport factor 2 family protein [Nocardia sp. SYP-A9097]MRH91684.1 hypothetical protein [Nocardia sp. SYP-A9097]